MGYFAGVIEKRASSVQVQWIALSSFHITGPSSIKYSSLLQTFSRYTGGATATGPALRYVRNNLIFSAAAGARNGAKKVVFVLTDGKSNIGIKPYIPAAQLRARRVIMFALGVTNNIRQSELLSIASSSAHVFHVASYAVLNAVTEAITGG